MQKVLDSGAVLNLSICSFEEGERLMEAVANELKNTKISLGLKGKTVDFLNLELGDDAINTIKNLVAGLLASKEVKAALWPCIERGTYNDIHIKRDIFEDEKVRADYIPILKEALVYNLSPFSKSLLSLVKGLVGASTSIQK